MASRPPASAPTDSAAAPKGTVTFVFTDIEGSTQRWDAHREAMSEAVRRHDALGRAALEAHGGYVFKTLGDAFCCAFERPEDALAATLAFQRALTAQDFSALGGLRMRAALHTGIADERDGDYFGPTLNRVARLLAIARGGQTVASAATHALVANSQIADVTFTDLGEHRLKDIAQTEHVYQVDTSDLPTIFPQLLPLGESPNNLPVELTSFVGRDTEVAAVTSLLEKHRFVTLVGSGGIGKTRTSLQVAANLLDGHVDGVWFVELAPLIDGALIASTVASALHITLAFDADPCDALVVALRAKHMVLVFDNCEHLIEGSARVIGAILRGAPGISILATSRQALGIVGESAYRMPSLEVPPARDPNDRFPVADAMAYGAIALFVERASAADARFVLTDENAGTVAEIVRRVDGIALAIELAAPRVKVLDIRQLAKRLDERFRLLTGGKRDVLPRQQTLRALFDWSYDLLSEPERVLFGRVGIFVDGFTMEAAARVCCDDALDEFDLLDMLASLVDKSLVVAATSDDDTRYYLLESARAYALEKLDAAGARLGIAQRHLDWIDALTNDVFERFVETLRDDSSRVLGPELENIRAALRLARAEKNDETYARIVSHAAELREIGIPRTELLDHLALATHLQSDGPPRLRANLAMLLSIHLQMAGRTLDAETHSMQAIALAEGAGDVDILLRSLGRGATMSSRLGKFDRSRTLLEQTASTDLSRATSLTKVIISLARAKLAFEQRSYEKADAHFNRVFEIYESLGAPMTSGVILYQYAQLKISLADYVKAINFCNDALTIVRDSNLRSDFGDLLLTARIELGDLNGVTNFARAQIASTQATDPSGYCTAGTIEQLANYHSRLGDLARAARLVGFVNKRFEELKHVRMLFTAPRYERLLEQCRSTLGEHEFQRLCAEGAAYSKQRAIDEALGDV